MGLSFRRPLISAVTNRHLLGDRDEEACARLVEWAAAVSRADIDVLQIRERGLSDAALAGLVRDILSVTAGSGLQVLVNDRTDIALATRAAGVHLPSSAPPPASVRSIVPNGFLIGRSVHMSDDVAEIERAGGCDYLVFGTVYPSAGKPPDHVVAGIEALRRVCAATTLPVLAIGGITVAHTTAIARAGAAGIAAIGLFSEPCRDETRRASHAARIAETVAALRMAFEVAGAV
jgi:thiamine-phosphate pyrophosphorylase